MPGASLTIDSVTASNTAPGGVTINPAFDGLADTVVASDVPIDDGDVHTYVVTMTVTLDVDEVTPANSDCDLTGGETGTGAMNQATLDVDGVTEEVETCEEFPSTIVIKEVIDGPTPLGARDVRGVVPDHRAQCRLRRRRLHVGRRAGLRRRRHDRLGRGRQRDPGLDRHQRGVERRRGGERRHRSVDRRRRHRGHHAHVPRRRRGRKRRGPHARGVGLHRRSLARAAPVCSIARR